MVRARSAVLLIGIFGTGCLFPGRTPEIPPPRQSPARDSLLDFDRSRNDSLVHRGFPAVMQSFLDTSVVYLRAGAHVAYGADRTLRLLLSPNREAAPFTGWQPLGGGVSRDRLTAYTFGIAVRAQPETTVPLIERYIAVWSRGRSTPWRIIAYLEVSPGVLSTLTGEKSSPSPPGKGARRDLLVTDSAFAERASMFGVASAVRGFLSDDGVLLGAVQLVVGPRAAGEYLEARRSVSMSWIPRDASVSASGDLGFTIGDAVSTSLGPTGAATQRFTKYLSVWRKDADGHWRLVATGSNDRPSPIGD